VGYALFIPVFFASIGLEISFKGMGNSWLLIAGMTILAFVTKWFGAGIAARITKSSWKESNVIGLGMVSRGEMALIFAQTGLAAGIVNQMEYSQLAIVILLTTILAPVALRKAL
jgi:Kef-type K+ transport system membrane component KefB